MQLNIFGFKHILGRAVFLASDEALFVLGEELVDDGGWTQLMAN